MISRTKAVLCLLMSISTANLQVIKPEICTDPTVTAFDGYLDTKIYYASFDRDKQSFLRFPNPYTMNQMEASVSVWMRLSRVNDLFSRGTLFDCSDSIQARINGTKLTLALTTKADNSSNAKLTTTEVEAELTNDIEQLLQWNNYAFSFKNSVMIIHFNGIQIASKTIPTSIMNKGSECTVGSTQDFRSYLHGHMRHLVYSNDGVVANQSIQSKIRVQPSPVDSKIAAYYKFDKDWQSYETYYFTSVSNIARQVNIMSSSEPENVCYCTTFPQEFLRVSKETRLNPIDLRQSMTTSTGVLDQDGIVFQFLINPVRLDQSTSPDSDQLIFSVPRMFEVRLANKSQSLRVDMFNQSVANSVTFKNYRFRFQTWTQYRILMQPNRVVLSVDGVQVDSATYALNTFNLTSQQLQVHQPFSLVYLLQSVQILDKLNRPVFNMTFTQDMLSGREQYLISGKFIFDVNNQLCPPADRINSNSFLSLSGDTCRDSRLYPLFGGAQSRGNLTALTGQLKSSGSTVTIEFWMKDLKSGTPFDMNSVILENSIANITQTQIALISNPALVSQKFLRVYPSIQANSSLFAEWRTPSRIQNHWIHIAIVNSPSSIRIITFNHTSRVEQAIQVNGISLLPYSQELNTSIGSQLNGNNKFQGLLREFKFWSNSRTDFNIQTTRYTSQVSSALLLHYFRMNSANELYSLEDSVAGYTVDEKATSFSSLVYATDRDLIVCRPGQYFNGQCCQQFNLNGVNFQISYNIAKSVIQTSVINETFVNPLLMNSMVANFSVISFGFRNNTAATTQIRRLFNINRTASVNVNSAFIDPVVFNFTVQARIYSIYGLIYKVVNKTFSLQCPNFIIQVNNQSQGIQGDSSFIVSPAPDAFLQLQLRSVQNQTMPTCYNPVTDTIQNVTISSQLWSQQLSVVNNALSFSNVWLLNSDNTTAIFNKASMVGQRWNRINTRVNYGQGLFTETSVNLTYSSVIPINQQYNQPVFSRHYLVNDNIDINLLNTSTTDPASLPDVTFSVICPSSLFSASDYKQLCQMNDRRFLLNSALLSNLIYGQYYQFQFLLGVQGTNIVRTITGNFMFYQDGSSRAQCPSISYSGIYEINKVDNTSLFIQPNAFLACGRVLWEPATFVSTAIDTRTLRTVTGVFSQPNISTNPLQQVVVQENPNVKALIGGSQLRVNSKITFRQVNQTGIRMPLNQTTLDVSYLVNVKKNSIVPVVQVTNQNRTQINPLSIGFTETNVTLNASLSFDPDNPSMQLNYTWRCPQIINDVTCRRMQSGLRNNTLVFPMLLKMQLGMLHGVNYEFSLTLNNMENPLAQALTTVISINFAAPLMNQTVPPEMRANSCDQIEVYSNQFFKQDLDSQEKIIQYNMNNWDQFIIKAQAKSTCSSPAVEYMQMYFFLFDGSTDNQVTTLFSQRSPVASVLETTMQTKDYGQLLKTQVMTPTQGGFFMFVKRVGSNRLSMIIDKVFFIRKYADLVAQISPDNLSVDQYQTFTLDASSSYDQETGANSNFTYSWVCPQFNEQPIPTSCQTSGSVLTVTYSDRMKLQANDIQAYEYKVSVKQGSRESQTASVIVNIIQRDDYSACINLNDKITNSPLSYDFSDYNRTMVWKKKQPVQFAYEIQPAVNDCDTVKVMRSDWSSSDQFLAPFWTADLLKANRISLTSDSLQYLTPSVNYTVIYTTKVQLGPDASNFFNKRAYLNVKILENIQPVVDTKQIFRYPIDTSVVITASLQDLGQNIRCEWDCPKEFGGDGCWSECTFNQSMVELNTYARMISNVSVADLFGQSLAFTVTIFVGEQSVQVPKTIYIIDSTSAQEPLTEPQIDQCSIKIYGQSDLQKLKKIVPQQTVFYFGCDHNDTLTSYILNPKYFNLQWDIEGLAQGVDFVNKSGQLFVNPYAFAKIKEGSTATISLDIFNAVTGLNVGGLRRLQEETTQEDPPIEIVRRDSAFPDEITTIPDETTTIPDEITTIPDETTTIPDETSTIPDETTTIPDETSTIPGETSTIPDETTTIPDETTTTTDNNIPKEETTPTFTDDGNTQENDPQTDKPIDPPAEEEPPVVDNSTVPVSQNDTQQQEQKPNSTRPQITQLDYNIVRTQIKPAYEVNRSVKQEVSFKLPVVTSFGQVQVTSQSGTMLYYVSNFTFRFSDYNTQPQQVIFFQLRALQDQLYNTFSILIPLKTFSKQNVDMYYQQVYLPVASEIYVDFFDGELNFLGSQQLKEKGQPLEKLTKMGDMTYTQIDKLTMTLQNKVSVGYMSITEATKVEFDQDMRRILEIAEFASLDGLQYMESISDTILTRIVSYLKTYFVYMQAQLDGNNFQERRQQLVNQKRVVLTYYNLLRKSTATETQLASALSIFVAATRDFETLCYFSGEDPELIQTAVLYVQNIFKGQLQVVKMSNKKQFFDMIQTVTDQVYQTEVKQNNNTLVKVQQTSDARSSRTIYRIDQDSNNLVLIENANNDKEYVRFTDREGLLYQLTGVSTLTVQYDEQQVGQLTNAGTQSLITVKGTDNAGKLVDVNFPENSLYSFEIGFTLKLQANRTLFSRGPNNESVELGCVYFDTKKNAWDRTGVQVVDYNPQTLQLTCKSFHLTQFSAQIFVVTLPKNNGSAQNQSNSTQNTTVITTPIYIGGNETYWNHKDIPYYINKQNDYIAAVVVVGVVSVLLPLITLIVANYKLKYNNQQLDLVDQSPCSTSFMMKLWSVMKVYHPLVSSVFAMTNPVLAIPRAYQLLTLEINLLAIALTSVIHLLYIETLQKIYMNNTLHKIYYSLIIFGGFLIIRNVLNKLKTSMYLKYAQVSLVKEDSNFQTQRPQENNRNQQYMMSNDSPSGLIQSSQNRLIHDQVTIRQEPSKQQDQDDRFDHFEGGESDEIVDVDKSEEGQRNTSQVDEDVYQPKIKMTSNNENGESIQRHDTHPDEEYKHNQYSNNDTQTAARDHFKIAMDGNSPLEAAKPFDGTSIQESAEDEIEDQQSSNLQALGPLNYSIQGPSDDSESGKRPLNQQSKVQILKNMQGSSATQSNSYREGNSKHYLKIQNEHSLKGAHILLFLFLILLVIGELVAIFILMRKVENKDTLVEWIKLCVGFSLIWIVGLDSLLCLIFAIIFGKAKSVQSTYLKLAAALIVQNADERALIQTNLEIKGIIN